MPLIGLPRSTFATMAGLDWSENRTPRIGGDRPSVEVASSSIIHQLGRIRLYCKANLDQLGQENFCRSLKCLRRALLPRSFCPMPGLEATKLTRLHSDGAAFYL
jgi:hypothetical protein